mmetsp:Transcript_12307/g.15990  ORF Transcript_12307/g.15990 Transcript_12307/m.15990 type:complete len:315 (-) Transcript_12307:262-1206(-)
MAGSGSIALVIFVGLVPLIAILALWVGSLYDKRLANVLYKLHLLREGGGHMLFSTDKKFPKKTPDAADVQEEASKQIIFVRHAESAWNLVFNKGFGKDFPGRLGDALKKEGKLFSTLDSVFVDSPLSKLGTDQADGLQRFIETGDTEFNELLFGQPDAGKSIIVSSNLRRALSTCTIGFWNRLRRTQEKIHVLSSLQEVTFNVDGMSLAKPYHSPQLADDELAALDYHSPEDFDADRYYNCSENHGNKEIKSSGYKRLVEFCDWCFDEKQDEYDNIIAAGHSLYFRFFFQYFLPKASTHVSKKTQDGKLFRCCL